MTKLQQSWVGSQHPPTQWNLGGGRGSSAYIKIKIKSKKFPFKKSLDVHCMGIPFTTTNTSNMDVQGVSISTASSIKVHGVSLSTTSITDVLSASLSSASSMNV
jgi:hypothetical protein